MSKPRVLVTGGAGYIGSHTCKALAGAGFEPIAFDDCRTGSPAFVRWGPLEIADLGDRNSLDRVLALHEPIAVVHLAASAYVAESVRDPALYYRNNVANSLTLLEAMRTRGIHQIVFSSSCATYGLPESLPMDETHPQRPINPYGHTKLVVENMLQAFGAAHELRWLALRYFNAAGGDPSGEIGIY